MAVSQSTECRLTGWRLDASPVLLKTRNRKRLRPNDVAEWELRIGKYRVFYNVEKHVLIVSIEAIGFKVGNVLYIRGKRRDL